MKQAWQIPAAVAATAVVTFSGVSALQAHANGPIRALGAKFHPTQSPTPMSTVLGAPMLSVPGGFDGDGDGDFGDVLAEAIWPLTTTAEASSTDSPVSAAPPLRPIGGRHVLRPDDERQAPISPAPQPVEAQAGPALPEPQADGRQQTHQESPDGAQAAQLAATGGSAATAAGPGEGQGRGQGRGDAPSPTQVPTVTEQQGQFTAWGTSEQAAESALQKAVQSASGNSQNGPNTPKGNNGQNNGRAQWKSGSAK